MKLLCALLLAASAHAASERSARAPKSAKAVPGAELVTAAIPQLPTGAAAVPGAPATTATPAATVPAASAAKPPEAALPQAERAAEALPKPEAPIALAAVSQKTSFDGAGKLGGAAPAVAAGPSAPREPELAKAPGALRKKLAKIVDKALAPLKLFTNRPSNDRDWSKDNAVLPYAEIDGDKITVRNVRNFKYTSAKDYEPAYYDKTFELSKIESVDFVLEPFSRGGTLAHTFLSFGFEGGERLAVSVEIRKVVGVSFSPWKGLWNNFEIAYVIGDERDLIGLRTNHRKNPVYLYPIKAPKDKIATMFLDMMKRANELKDKPEFYNTITNTCLSNILRHYNKVSQRKVGFGPRTFFTGFSDRIAYQLGLIDNSIPLEEARARYRINERAAGHDQNPDFSQLIRK